MPISSSSSQSVSADPKSSLKPPRAGKKKPEYTGSRWAGLILFLVTLLTSLLFYLKGQLNSGSFKSDFNLKLKLSSFIDSLSQPSVYTLEK